MQTDVEKTTEKTAGAQAVQAAKWLYVGDTVLKQILVYPVQGDEPAGKLELGDAPFALACNSKGELFVSLVQSNEVLVFSGGPHSVLVTAMTDLSKPMGIGIDSKDQVYVADHGVNNSSLAMYKPGSVKVDQMIAVPVPFAPVGVCVDRQDVVYATCYENIGGFVFQFVQGEYKQAIYPVVNASGIARGVGNTLVAVDATALVTIAPPNASGPWHKTDWDQLGIGHAIRLIASGPDNTIYAPVFSADEVYVQIQPPPAGSGAVRKITTNLKSPFCCAVGS